MVRPAAVASCWIVYLALPASCEMELPEPFAAFSKPGRRWPEEPCSGLPSAEGVGASLRPGGTQILTSLGRWLLIANSSALLDACELVASITLRPNLSSPHPSSADEKPKSSVFAPSVTALLSLSSGGLAVATQGRIFIYSEDALGTGGKPDMQLALSRSFSNTVALAEIPAGGLVAAVSDRLSSYARVFYGAEFLDSSNQYEEKLFLDLQLDARIHSLAVMKGNVIALGTSGNVVEIWSPGLASWVPAATLFVDGNPETLTELHDGALAVGTTRGALHFFSRSAALHGSPPESTHKFEYPVHSLVVLPDGKVVVGTSTLVFIYDNTGWQHAALQVSKTVSTLLYEPKVGLVVGTWSGAVDIFSEAALLQGGTARSTFQVGGIGITKMASLPRGGIAIGLSDQVAVDLFDAATLASALNRYSSIDMGVDISRIFRFPDQDRVAVAAIGFIRIYDIALSSDLTDPIDLHMERSMSRVSWLDFTSDGGLIAGSNMGIVYDFSMKEVERGGIARSGVNIKFMSYGRLLEDGHLALVEVFPGIVVVLEPPSADSTTWRRYTHVLPEFLQKTRVTAIELLPSGDLAFGTVNGIVFLVDPATLVYGEKVFLQLDQNPAHEPRCKHLYGLGNTARKDARKSSHFRLSLTESAGAEWGRVHSIFPLPGGRLAIGGSGSVSIFEPGAQDATATLRTRALVNSILELPQGAVLLGGSLHWAESNRGICPAGTFSPDGHHQCFPCPTGWRSNPGSGSCVYADPWHSLWVARVPLLLWAFMMFCLLVAAYSRRLWRSMCCRQKSECQAEFSASSSNGSGLGTDGSQANHPAGLFSAPVASVAALFAIASAVLGPITVEMDLNSMRLKNKRDAGFHQGRFSSPAHIAALSLVCAGIYAFFVARQAPKLETGAVGMHSRLARRVRGLHILHPLIFLLILAVACTGVVLLAKKASAASPNVVLTPLGVSGTSASAWLILSGCMALSFSLTLRAAWYKYLSGSVSLEFILGSSCTHISVFSCGWYPKLPRSFSDLRAWKTFWSSTVGARIKMLGNDFFSWIALYFQYDDEVRRSTGEPIFLTCFFAITCSAIVNSLALASHTFSSRLPYLLTVADGDFRCSTVLRISVVFSKFRYLVNPVTRPVKDCRANDNPGTCEVPYAWSCARQAVGSCPEWCIGSGHECFVLDVLGHDLPQRCHCAGTSPLRWTVIAGALASVLSILGSSLSQAWSWRGRVPALGLTSYIVVACFPQFWLLSMIVRLSKSTNVEFWKEHHEWRETDTFKLAFVPVLFSELLANECNSVLGPWFGTEEGEVPVYTVTLMSSSGLWLLRPVTTIVSLGCAFVAFRSGHCLDLAVVLFLTAIAAFLTPNLLNLSKIASSPVLQNRTARRAQRDAMLQSGESGSALESTSSLQGSPTNLLPDEAGDGVELTLR